MAFAVVSSEARIAGKPPATARPGQLRLIWTGVLAIFSTSRKPTSRTVKPSVMIGEHRAQTATTVTASACESHFSASTTPAAATASPTTRPTPSGR